MTNKGKIVIAAMTGLATGLAVNWLRDMINEDVSDYVEKHRVMEDEEPEDGSEEISEDETEEEYVDLDEEPEKDTVTISKKEYDFLNSCLDRLKTLTETQRRDNPNDYVVYYGCPNSLRVRKLNLGKNIK